MIASWGFVILFVMTVAWLLLRRLAKRGVKRFDPALERAKVYHMIRDLWDFIYNTDDPCTHARLYPLEQRVDDFFQRTKGLAISFDKEFIHEYMNADDSALFQMRAGITPDNLYTHEDKQELAKWLERSDWHIFPLHLYWKLIKGAISNTCQLYPEKPHLIKKLLPMMRIIDLDEKLDK